MKIGADPKCQMCMTADETVSHLLTGCSNLAGSDYLARHNEVGKIIHRNICTEYGIPVVEPYWRHQPLSVTETEEMKILWKMEIQTDRRHEEDMT